MHYFINLKGEKKFFVEEGTVLDKEAFKRCNSVYLAVI